LIRNPEGGGGAEKLRDLGVNGRFKVKKALAACWILKRGLYLPFLR
jgi:hypothetical protein